MQKIKSALSHSLFRSSFIVFAGSTAVNFLNYLFTLLMGRLLGPVHYSEIASIMVLLFITGVPSTTLILLVAKYTSRLKAQKDTGLFNHFLAVLTSRINWVGASILVLFWIFTPILSTFLHIDWKIFIIFSIILPVNLICALNTGVLQGSERFFSYSMIAVIANLSKLVLGVLLVYIGYSVFGVVVAIVIGSILALWYSRIQVYSYINTRYSDTSIAVSSSIHWKDIYSYGLVIFITSMLVTLIANIDILLAKHYLTSFEAGQYSALSIMGKIIMYAPGAAVAVMYPKFLLTCGLIFEIMAISIYHQNIFQIILSMGLSGFFMLAGMVGIYLIHSRKKVDLPVFVLNRNNIAG